jgi:hypothetical protein
MATDTQSDEVFFWIIEVAGNESPFNSRFQSDSRDPENLIKEKSNSQRGFSALYRVDSFQAR